jgi:phosphoribosyl 1,2-cyclic phosphodiesterase
MVDPFSVPHDAANPVGFVLAADGVRVGIATDLGHATNLVVQRLRGCHVLVVEANHDDDMLVRGPYPWALKQRISGRLGHLSNEEAATLLVAVADDDCQAVILAHLSESNNTAALARKAVASALARAGRHRYAMRVAERRLPTPAVEI